MLIKATATLKTMITTLSANINVKLDTFQSKPKDLENNRFVGMKYEIKQPTFLRDFTSPGSCPDSDVFLVAFIVWPF